MKTKTINLYEYSELSEKAKKKAIDKWQEVFDDYGLLVHLDNEVEYFLEENGITCAEGTMHAKIYYSLSYSQGDGAMFEGIFDWKQYRVYIKHIGRYSHSNSATIELQEKENLGIHMDNEHEDVKKFDTIYKSICKELEKSGYAYIEDMQSEEFFIEECNANEWTFREDGTMENE